MVGAKYFPQTDYLWMFCTQLTSKDDATAKMGSLNPSAYLELKKKRKKRDTGMYTSEEK